MTTIRTGLATVMALAVAGLAPVASSAAAPPPAGNGASQAKPAAELAGDGHAWPEGLREAADKEFAADAFRLRPQGPEGDAWSATNRAHGFEARFSPSSLTVEGMTMSVSGWGRGNDLHAPERGRLVTSGNRAEYLRGSLREWYVNDERGIEQGFTLDAAPTGDSRGPLVVELSVAGELRPRLAHDGATVELAGEGGGTVLTYGGLHAYDATGAELSSRLAVEGSAVRLEVTDAGAAYPLTIDPLIASQRSKVTAVADAAAGDQLGRDIAVSGNTAVVGAALRDGSDAPDAGGAYVFERSGTTWSTGTQLIPTDAASYQNFGSSVAISGNTVVVGAQFDSSPWRVGDGSAYVFVRSGATWSQQAKLTASDSENNDYLGAAVAISGDTAVVGSGGDDGAGGEDQGSAYVFVRSGTTWSQQRKLTASDGAGGDSFGVSIAFSGETAVVGAQGDDGPVGADQGSAYVFVRAGTTWSQQRKLSAADGAASDYFGGSVALSGETALVGAHFDDGLAGASQGSAYAFVRSGTIWSQQVKLTAIDDAAVGDHFGKSMAVSGDTALVGSNNVFAGQRGGAYVFVRSGTRWSPQAKLTASDGAAFDSFGRSVGVSGDTVLVGSHRDDGPAGADQGSAYVFFRSGTTWSPQGKLTASDGAASDSFGFSVALSDNIAGVGASYDDGPAGADQGSAYVFVRSGTTWSQQRKLTVSDGAASDLFGVAVAVLGNTILVGASSDDGPAAANQGSAYLFARSATGGWWQQAKLSASDGAASDYFGSSVALSADTALVGALHDQGRAGAEQGSVYDFLLSEYQVQVAVGDVSVTEGRSGSRTAYFPVTLDRPSSIPVTVQYAAADATAIRPGDYTVKSGTLSIPPGAVSAFVAVAVNGDATAEATETFQMNLTSPTDAVITDAVGVGTIVDDDPLLVLQLTPGDITIHEGHAATRTAYLTVSLSAASTSTVTVNYSTANITATNPGDYASGAGTLTFSPGVITRTVPLNVKADTVVEAQEQFKVIVSSPTGGAAIADDTGVVTITNDDR